MNFTILIDTREQAPLAFDGFSTARATLATGDESAPAGRVTNDDDIRF